MNRITAPFILVTLTFPFPEEVCDKIAMHYSPITSVAANNFEDALNRLFEVLADGINRFLHISVAPGVSSEYVLRILADEVRLAAEDNYFGSAKALLHHTSEILAIMAVHLQIPWQMILKLPDTSEEFAGSAER